MTDTATQAKIVDLIICGTPIPMRPTVSKAGNTYHAVRQQFTASGAPGKWTGFGEPVPPLDEHLPESVEVAGVTVPLTDVLRTEYKGEVKDHAPGTRRQGEAVVSVDGEDRRFRLTLSIRGNGDWNVKSTINRMGGGGGGGRKGSLATL